jgi:hypothetical protein
MYRRDFMGAIKLAEKAVALIALVPGGDVERSLEMHKQILAARLDLQGRASYFTLQSYYAIGALYYYLGRLDEAEYVLVLGLHPLSYSNTNFYEGI